jgi:hypothetical protein
MSTILKRHSRRILLQAKRDCSDQVHSDQMVLGTGRWKAGPQERWPKALKTKLTQGGPGVHSDQMVLVMARQEAGPYERWPKTLKGQLEDSSRKPRDLVGKLA